MANVGNVEVTIGGGGYGNDLLLDSTGDLVLSLDTDTSSQATKERITRLVLTTPTLRDANGNPIGFADDIFHPQWGAGLRAYVDGAFNAQTLQNIASAVQQELAADPAVANTPTPIVSLSLQSTYAATLSVTFWTTTGQKQVLPTITLTPTSVSVSA